MGHESVTDGLLSSPDLIVHGVLGQDRSMDQIRAEMRGILERLVSLSPRRMVLYRPGLWLCAGCMEADRRQHVLVVGPGLGRDDHMQSCARIAFELAKEMDQLGVVVDADGLWLVQVSLPASTQSNHKAGRG